MATVQKYDTVVIGLGAVGSFALRAVAREVATKNAMDGTDRQVLGIERFERCHDRGSSHGHSRIYRMAYFEHPSYVPWVQYSVKEFKALEEETNGGNSILNPCGVLVVVPRKDRKWLDASLASAAMHSIPIETLSIEELRRRFPQFRYTNGGENEMMGVYESGGGMVRPERAIDAALKEVEQKCNAAIWENTIVHSLKEVKGDSSNGSKTFIELVVERRNPSGGERSESVVVEARTVLIGAGAWTSTLIPSWEPHLKPVRILQTWVNVSKTSHPRHFDTPTMPCAVMVNPKLPIPVYCLPADSEGIEYNLSTNKSDGHARYKNCIKLGVHGGESIDPNVNSIQDITTVEEEEMYRAIQTTFCDDVAAVVERAKTDESKLGGAKKNSLLETKPCMYTMTSDEHFLIGTPSGMGNVCAVAGLSGHGFKMAPALGQMLADFAIAADKGERQSMLNEKWKAGFCSPSRFGV